jgi:predicted PurR-regulated permease PerM
VTNARAFPASGPAVWLIAILVAVFFLRASRQLLIPIVLGVLISYALEPLVAWLERRRLPRVAGASLVLAVLLGVAGWGAYTLRDDALEATEALPSIARRAREMVSSRSGSGPAANVRAATEELSGQPQGGGSASPSPPSAGDGQSALGQIVQRVVPSVLALAGHITVVVFLVFFLLLSGGHFKRRLVEIAGPRLERRRITAEIIDDINAQIGRFLLVRLATAAVVALATWLVLQWMGVQQAAVWGILAGVFNSIPYFGPVIVSGGLFFVGLVQFGDAAQAIKISGAALLVTTLEGWLLTPPLLGKAERMHVLVVFLGVLVWSWIWGAWGTILAVPMLVVIKAVCDHVEALKPVGRLLSP